MTVSLVLRLCGLLLCLLHTVNLSASLILLRLDLPSARYDIVAAILENSSFLPLGLLLVLLSLHPQLLRPRLSEAGEPGEAAPALLLKSRPLIALLAAAYIALLPAQIQGALSLRSLGSTRLDAIHAARLAELEAINQINQNPAALPQVIERLQRLASLSRLPPLPLIPSTPRQASEVGEVLRAALQDQHNDSRRVSDRDLWIRSLRHGLMALLYGAYLLVLWAGWPQAPQPAGDPETDPPDRADRHLGLRH